jgi:hypothetical protein
MAFGAQARKEQRSEEMIIPALMQRLLDMNLTSTLRVKVL